MSLSLLLILAALAMPMLAAILYEPSAARLAADAIERTAFAAMMLLRAHAAAREAARAAYRRTFRAVRAREA